MAWIRKLDSGLWAATVRTPAGRVTESWPLKAQAKDWAAGLEDEVRRGDFIDPRLAETRVGDVRRRFSGARRIEKNTAAWEASVWKNHTGPKWEKWPIGAILRPDVNAWIVDMEKSGVGAHTIHAAVNVLKGLCELAVDGRMIRSNPAHRCKLPPIPDHIDRVISPAEERLLLASLDEKFGDRADGRLFVELLIECGLRWEEAAGLDRAHVDMRRSRVHVAQVLERDGSLRPYPKSKKGDRQVPVGKDLWPRLRDHAMTRRPEGLLFSGRDGAPMNYHNWLKRVWKPALHEIEKGKHGKILSRTPLLDLPLPTPHDCRHTFGTRLAEQGVPTHEIGALMGHADARSTQRYTHATENRFERARSAMERARSDSQVTHDVG